MAAEGAELTSDPQQSRNRLLQLQAELQADLGRLRRRHSELVGEIENISDEMERGIEERAHLVEPLLPEEDKTQSEIVLLECTLDKIAFALEEINERARKAELE